MSPSRKFVMRGVTLAILSSVAAGCTAPATAGRDSGPSPTPPGVEQVISTIRSLEARVNELSDSPNVKKQDTVVDLTDFGNTYSPDSFKPPSLFDVGIQGLLLPKTASMYTITYDRDTNTLTYQVTHPLGISPGENQEYHILEPLVNNPVLKLALANGTANKVEVRLSAPDKSTLEGFNVGDKIFLSLPQKMETITYRNAIIHETLHSLTAGSDLSPSTKNLQPQPQEFEKWQEVCGNIRDIAIDEAETRSQTIISLMRKAQQEGMFSGQKFNDPGYAKAFQEVLDALVRGDFNREQPTINNDFEQKAPNCKTIGPVDAFMALLKKEGLSLTPIKADDPLLSKISKEWSEIIRNETIFSELREGPYNKIKGAPNDLAGHPYESWDEMIASLNYLIIAEPDNFGATINKLPPDEKKAALELVSAAVVTLDQFVDESLPDTKDKADFIALLRAHYALWQTKVNQN